MPHWLKRGMDAGAIKAADAKVRETVENILAQVEDHKDQAIRDPMNYKPDSTRAFASSKLIVPSAFL